MKMTSVRLRIALLRYLSICILVVVVCPTQLWAACAKSGVEWTATADYESVSYCVSRASAGDTIVVSGNATWTNTLVLTRGINLVGSGNPIIRGPRRLIQWSTSAAARTAHDTLLIRGFTLDVGNATFAQMESAGIVTVRSGSGGHVQLIVANNTFKNAPESIRGLYLQGDVWGVAYSNVFDRVGIPLGVYGNDYNTWNSYTRAYGSPENFYFEDNTMVFTSTFQSGHSGYIQSGQGGRVVVRYNSWDYTNVPAPGSFWDVHGLQGPRSVDPLPPSGCENYSTMVAEYYGNKLINQVNAYRWIEHRGGWLLMFFNLMIGTSEPYNGITQYFCNACQLAGSFNQKAHNSYVWRNLANQSERPLLEYSPGALPFGCTADPLVEDVDYFNYATGFDGSTGVGCGSLASRPLTCTPGVGYWATAQSCSDLSAMTGANPLTPIEGTLYKCTSTNSWSAYYKPYSYPHPLREESRAPSQPQNVSVKQ